MSPEIVGLLVIAFLFALFFMGLEIGFAMAIAGFVGYGIIVNFQAAFKIVAMDFYTVFSSYGFLVIPLFILMGQIGTGGGISKALYNSAYRFLGHIPGGLAMDMAFAILSIPIFVPIIVKLGYDPVWFGIVFAVTGMIGIILPPMAMSVFVVSGITKTPIGVVYKGIYPFLACMSIVLLLLVLFPQISLWLPQLLMGA